MDAVLLKALSDPTPLLLLAAQRPFVEDADRRSEPSHHERTTSYA